MFRLILRVLTFAYAALLMLLLVALEWWGERNWFLSLLLFAPPWLFLTPLLLLTPLSLLLLRWRLLLVQLGCVLLVVFGYMTFRWTPEKTLAPDGLTVVTHNIGEGDRKQFADFLKRQNPDVILLQDSQFRSAEFARRYPAYQTASRGEFTCLSKYPIKEAMLLEKLQSNRRPVAARFEIVVQEKLIAVYSVHMPTPRQQFHRFLSRRFLTEVFGEEEQSERINNYKEWNAARTELAGSLAGQFSSEKLPFIAAGDFNMPDHGGVYHLFAGQMTDAFAKAGRGWGLTFPGEVSNPVAIFGPWLRIDFIFAGKGWAPLYCEAEPGWKSQHRAVVARLRPDSAN